MSHAISTRPLGNTGLRVSQVGLGGEGVLRTHGRAPEAVRVISEALDQGVTYFDCAHAYAGSEGYYGRVWSEKPETRRGIFQASKSARRDKKGALQELDATLESMHLDHLDLWQIHDVRTREDLEAIGGPGGALEAFLDAKASGKTRFIGVTGHHDPAILTQALRDWPVDTVMMPINPIEAALGGFLTETLPAALDRGLGVIAMKVLGGSHYLFPEGGVTAELLIRFALSQSISVAIVGCSSPAHVAVLAQSGRDFVPMDSGDQQELVKAFAPHARRLAFYRGVV